MRRMAGRAIRITSRIVFFACGLVSLITGVPYALLRGVDLPFQSEWIIFVVALAAVGVCGLAAGVLPRSWVARACGTDRDDERLLSVPLRLLGVFAAFFYLLALVAYLAPHRWNLNPQLMFAVCPLYLLKMNFDPSPVAVLFLLAPMNAAVYGALGLTLGYLWLAFRKRLATG